MFLSNWLEFPSAPCLAGKETWWQLASRFLLKYRASVTCFWACFLPGRARDLSAPRCIPETNCVCTLYSVTAVLYLQFVLHVKLFRPWNMFCTFTVALSAVCLQCPIWLFFLQFFNFVLSLYVAQLLSQLFSNGSNLLLPVSLLLSHSTCAVFLS